MPALGFLKLFQQSFDTIRQRPMETSRQTRKPARERKAICTHNLEPSLLAWPRCRSHVPNTGNHRFFNYGGKRCRNDKRSLRGNALGLGNDCARVYAQEGTGSVRADGRRPPKTHQSPDARKGEFAKTPHMTSKTRSVVAARFSGIGRSSGNKSECRTKRTGAARQASRIVGVSPGQTRFGCRCFKECSVIGAA